MHLKHTVIFLCCLLSLLSLSSCLGDDDLETVILTDDALIYSFSLSSDSVSELSSVTFSIDQINGKIFNQDSMAYGTEFKDKAIVYFVTSSYATFEIVGDTIHVTKDSIDISSKNLQFKVAAAGESKVKLYDFKINVHTVDPDAVRYLCVSPSLPLLDADETKAIVYENETYIYTKNANTVSCYKKTGDNWSSTGLSGFPSGAKLKDIQVGRAALFVTNGNGELYISYDAAYWYAITTPYNIQTILGYLFESSTQEEGLSVIVDDNEGKIRHAFTRDLIEWELGSEIPSTGFPAGNFESQSYKTMNTQRIVVFGGTDMAGEMLNSVWSTEDGLYWVKINSAQSSFPVLEKFNALVYNEEMFVFNGKLKDGTMNKEVYYSPDGGNTWRSENTKANLPISEGYSFRYDATVIKDNEEIYFYIVGGKNAGNITDVWRGHKNKYLFID